MPEKSKMIPNWIRPAPYDRKDFLKTKDIVQSHNLNTVCVEADCPNRYECFSKKTATFMILGDICTRNCKYCNINKGKPKKVDPDEPKRIARAIKRLGLDYAVITCVTRDDLEDGGAGQFVETVKEIRKVNPGCKVELLISDLQGDALKRIIGSKPDVLNHNIEVVKDLFPNLRPEGDYERSLELLKRVKESGQVTKSGFMVGLGEEDDQIYETIKDLHKAGCDTITIGQYLQPNPECHEVRKYYRPGEFEVFREFGEKLGLKVIAGPMVRSSYKANEAYKKY
ncbi:MAG: lipoyl synthase [Candidatus Woesearchaeota archaeon]